MTGGAAGARGVTGGSVRPSRYSENNIDLFNPLLMELIKPSGIMFSKITIYIYYSTIFGNKKVLKIVGQQLIRTVANVLASHID